MVTALAILDGASEPLGDAPTSLERARTPTLDRLASEGLLTRLRTTPDGLEPGSEIGIPALLGWRPPAPVDRAALEAAARGIEVADGNEVWRVDVHEGHARATPEAVARVAGELRARLPEHAVHSIGGHRLLIHGRPPLPRAALAAHLRVWERGAVPARILDSDTVMVAAAGAASGAARLMGASVIVPRGATGRPDTDLAAKAAAALQALRDGAGRVVVHVGGPDEASHDRDARAKVEVLERIDGELLGPLAAALQARGATLTICCDHGCDPVTGEHDAAPVPCLSWPAEPARRPAGAGRAGARFTERAVSELAETELRELVRQAA